MKYLSLLALLASVTEANVSITTVYWASEVKFEILDDAGKVVCSGGPYPDNGKTYPIDGCTLPQKITIKCIDTCGDGWHGGYIQIGEKKYCEDFRTGLLKVVPLELGFSTYDHSSTGGFSGNNWNAHNVKKEG